MVFITGMTIWILAFVLLASGIGMGWRQGAIRAAFSFVGILFAALLAVPLGKLFKPLLPHLGIHDQIMVWLVAPIVAFVLVLAGFKVAAFFVHHKAKMFYKYKAGDLRLSLWERLNSRLGACLGVLNGAAYLVLVCFLIYNFTYWTIQLPSEDDARLIKLVNRMGSDLASTGATKIARAIDGLPPVFFQTADLAGLLYQNGALADRLARYPAFLSLAERDEFKQLGQDNDFENGWKNRAPIGALLKNPHAKNILQNDDLRQQVFGIVQKNLNDLTNYLETGKSPKFDQEKILGRWDFNVGVSLAMVRQAQPNIPSNQMKAIRAMWTQVFAETTFIAAGDGQAFLKKLPNFKNQPPTPETWNGSWSANDTNYDLTLSSNGENKSMTATSDGARLTLKDDKNTLVFDHED
jgi:hypothetical protein